MYTKYTMLTKVANPLGKPHKTKLKRDSRGHSNTIEKTKNNKTKKSVHTDQGVRGRAPVWASLSLMIACFSYFW